MSRPPILEIGERPEGVEFLRDGRYSKLTVKMGDTVLFELADVDLVTGSCIEIRWDDLELLTLPRLPDRGG